ncbi:MAG TPA: carboxypeptidase-like regulatory domain-containing protein [Gemmatimonadales bacterium]|jgi:hypothetical protein
MRAIDLIWSAVRWRGVLAVALMALATAVLPAQELRGRLVDASSRRPVVTALVELRNAADGIVSQEFTTASGAFVLPAPTATGFHIIIAAIGYARHAPIGVAPGDSTLADVLMKPVAFQLPELQAMAGKRSCGASDTTNALGGLLESAQASLQVMDAALHLGQIGFRTETISSNIVRRSHDSNTVTADTSEAMLHRWPAVTASLDTLQRVGFGALTVNQAGSAYIFWGPDLSVLFSGWFLAAHCYRVDGKHSTADSVVVTFEPNHGSSRVDVSGELVLDRATLTLRRLSYVHRNLPGGLPSGSVGGEMHFGEPIPGYLIPMDWSLHSPITRFTRMIDFPRMVTVPGQRGARPVSSPISSGSVMPRVIVEVVGRHEIHGRLTRIVPVTGTGP